MHVRHVTWVEIQITYVMHVSWDNHTWDESEEVM